ncbi:MAG: hypothetical protein F6K47_29880 [Symploca sp. SIO2E6]|nr:hypothetical protein [Symploca sp. SIO2E6]
MGNWELGIGNWELGIASLSPLFQYYINSGCIGMIKNLAFWLENIDTLRAQALRPYQSEYYPNVAGIDITQVLPLFLPISPAPHQTYALQDTAILWAQSHFL